MRLQRRRLLKFLKGARLESEGGKSRSKRALNRGEVGQLLDLWARDRRPLGAAQLRPAAPDDLHRFAPGRSGGAALG